MNKLLQRERDSKYRDLYERFRKQALQPDGLYEPCRADSASLHKQPQFV